MKYVWMAIRLLLPVAAIVLLTLWLAQGSGDQRMLAAGLLCSSLGIWLNIWFQRRERKKAQ